MFSKLCIEPNCNRYTIKTRCVEHARQREQARGSSTARGYDAVYRLERSKLLASNPMCVWQCGRIATTADHMPPLKYDSVARTLLPSCQPCNSAHRAEQFYISQVPPHV